MTTERKTEKVSDERWKLNRHEVTPNRADNCNLPSCHGLNKNCALYRWDALIGGRLEYIPGRFCCKAHMEKVHGKNGHRALGMPTHPAKEG